MTYVVCTWGFTSEALAGREKPPAQIYPGVPPSEAVSDLECDTICPGHFATFSTLLSLSPLSHL